MKSEIHAANYNEVTVNCSCGNQFITKSTVGNKSLHIEICSKCHPFYTGQQKLIDTAGQVDKFKRRYSLKK
ncbi:MAG: 50S ribosomal protein L31 [Methylacidiphilales bacterium]|nr:50S ribosomal protein L31 [Candidatus Methylacidiphilales bacterium]